MRSPFSMLTAQGLPCSSGLLWLCYACCIHRHAGLGFGARVSVTLTLSPNATAVGYLDIV